MIERDPIYYVTGYKGDDPYEAPFYLRSLVFDGKDGDVNSSLIRAFNEHIKGGEKYAGQALTLPGIDRGLLPARIVIVNASHDNLPTSYETARIFEDYLKEKDLNIGVKVVNDREELVTEAGCSDGFALVISQCVDRNVYNVALSEALEKEGTVTVPGRVTAPGSVFSDKDSTYRLLSDSGKKWDKVARYRKVSVEGKDTPGVVRGIFEAIDELSRETGDKTFFVKPHEGGGGLGGFRITRAGQGYIIPDLSKVSGDISEVHPTFIDIDTSSEARMRELLWIYRLFAADELMSANYLKIRLPVTGAGGAEDLKVLREYLEGSREKRSKKLSGMIMAPEKAEKTLVRAIDIFETKFEKRYTPLVNEHMDFGLWGLRAHYRLSRRGAVLEAMYHRIFQLAFTEEGLGYLGSDNISNKQTGDLEILRLGPVNRIMLDSIGGEEALFDTLEKGADALMELARLVPQGHEGKVPIRVQLDLAALSRRIGEGNADTARGLCLASRWTDFVASAREWLEDSLAYYAWKKKTEKQ
jgi:hypothetical protein